MTAVRRNYDLRQFESEKLNISIKHCRLGNQKMNFKTIGIFAEARHHVRTEHKFWTATSYNLELDWGVFGGFSFTESNNRQIKQFDLERVNKNSPKKPTFKFKGQKSTNTIVKNFVAISIWLLTGLITTL